MLEAATIYILESGVGLPKDTMPAHARSQLLLYIQNCSL